MEEFEKALVEVFNSSALPFEAKRYVMKHLYEVIDAKLNDELLRNEIATLKKEIEELKSEEACVNEEVSNVDNVE